MVKDELQPAERLATRGKELFELWRQIVAQPISFYCQLSEDEKLTQPVVFVCVVAAINALFVFLVQVPHPLAALASAATTFISFVAGTFIWAGVTMALCKSMGSQLSFARNYQVCAYATAPNVLLWLPFFDIFTMLYAILIFKIGLEEVHKLTKARAAAVVGIESAIGAAVGAAVFFASISALIKGGGS